MWGNWNFLQPSIWGVVSLLFLITSVAIAFIVVSENRSPYKTAAWILALVLLPVVGLVFYLFSGRNTARTRCFRAGDCGRWGASVR